MSKFKIGDIVKNIGSDNKIGIGIVYKLSMQYVGNVTRPCIKVIWLHRNRYTWNKGFCLEDVFVKINRK